LKLDADTQPRVEIDREVVADYAARMKAGDEFPPITIFRDKGDDSAWPVGDGFHRIEAAEQCDKKTISCVIRDVPDGSNATREARLYAAGANAEHGLRRSNADKRRAVEMLLGDPEWFAKSNRLIGKHAKVDHKTVGSIRAELGKSPVAEKRRGPGGITKREAAVQAAKVIEKRLGQDGKLRLSSQSPPDNGKWGLYACIEQLRTYVERMFDRWPDDELAALSGKMRCLADEIDAGKFHVAIDSEASE
jgi:hypothetical protein